MLEAIYDIVGREEALCTLLAHLARRSDCPSAAIVYIDSVRPLAAIEVGHGLFTDVVRARYHAEFAAIDPAPAALARLKIGEAAATDRVFSPGERAESRFLKEFYHPLGLQEAMGAPIAAALGRFGIVAVHCGAARPPFGDAEIAEFAELATHIAPCRRPEASFLRDGAAYRGPRGDARRRVGGFDRARQEWPAGPCQCGGPRCARAWRWPDPGAGRTSEGARPHRERPSRRRYERGGRRRTGPS